MFQRLILKLYLILQAYAFATKLDTEPSCPKLLAELGDFQKNLVTCVTHNSVPVQICSNCKIVYGNMTKQYKRLSNCSEYFDQDRLNLIPTTQNLLSSIWSKAYCNGKCFGKTVFTGYPYKCYSLSIYYYCCFI